MGMGVGDFEGMDTDEFLACCRAFDRHVEASARGAWERARIVGVLAISPYSKHSLRPERVLPLPWDKGKRPAARGMARNACGKEEARRRFLKIIGGQ